MTRNACFPRIGRVRRTASDEARRELRRHRADGVPDGDAQGVEHLLVTLGGEVRQRDREGGKRSGKEQRSPPARRAPAAPAPPADEGHGEHDAPDGEHRRGQVQHVAAEQQGVVLQPAEGAAGEPPSEEADVEGEEQGENAEDSDDERRRARCRGTR